MHTRLFVSVYVKYTTQMSTMASLICLGPSFQNMSHLFLLHGSLRPTNLEKKSEALLMNRYTDLVRYRANFFHTLYKMQADADLYYLGLDGTKPVLRVWEQHRCRPACASGTD